MSVLAILTQQRFAGFPTGGTKDQMLTKSSNKEYQFQWADVPENGVISFNNRKGEVSPQAGDYTASDVGAVPTTRKINNKALSSDITLGASDVNAVPTTRTVNGKALNADITLDADDVNARAATWFPTAAEVGAAAASHTHNYLPLAGGTVTGKTTYTSSLCLTGIPNNKNMAYFIGIKAFAAGGDIEWIAKNDVVADIGAVPTTRTVNGKALSENISLGAGDVGAAASTHTHDYLPLTGGTLTGPLTIGKMRMTWNTSTNSLDFEVVS